MVDTVDKAIQEASRLLGKAVASGELPASALNPFQRTQGQRSTVSRLLARWVRTGKLGGRVTEGDLPDLVSRLIGLGPLDGLVLDGSVISIQVVAHDRVLAQRSGVWREEPGVAWDSPRDLRAFGEALAARAGQQLSPERLVCQASFENPPGRIQIDGTARNESRLTIHIRLGRRREITLRDMEASGTMSASMRRFLVRVAQRTLGALIVGLPGTGKTTLLEAWLEHWPRQPAIALDDRSEFHPRHPLIVTYDVPAERLSEACSYALRKNVERMTIAELRGDEAAEMLRYSGALTCWTTLHGTTRNAVSRMMALVQGAEGSPYVNIPTQLLRRIIAQAFPLLVETDKLVIGGRAVFFVSRIVHLDENAIPRPLFQADVQRGEIAFVSTGDAEAFLARYRRRQFGGASLPSPGMLAGLVDRDPSLALVALGQMLQVRPNDRRVIALTRRLVRENEDIRAVLRRRYLELRTCIDTAVDEEDWARAQRLVHRALSNPLFAVSGDDLGRLELADVAAGQLAQRARAAAEAEEVLRLARRPQHLLSLLGQLERAESHPGLGRMADALRERVAELRPRAIAEVQVQRSGEE
jgi:pilus assembly protein CpaF